MSQKDIEDSLYERFNEQLGAKVNRIECYAEAVGKEMRRQLVCNYISQNNTNISVKYIGSDDINTPVWAISHHSLDAIDYVRDPQLKVHLLIPSFGAGDKKLTRADLYALNAVVDGISAGQPR